MTGRVNRVVARNRRFYDALYGSHSPVTFLLHGWLSYDQTSKTRLNRAVLEPVIRNLRARGRRVRVLDYGSGWGTFLLGLPRSDVDPWAFDLSRAATRLLIRAGRLAGRRIREARPGPRASPGPGGFDVILCSHVLEHVPSDRRLMTALARALRPGGHLLVNVPIHEVWHDPKHVRAYDRSALSQLFRRAGFRVVATRMADRWTGWLLRHELRWPAGSRQRGVLRLLRGALAVAPHRLGCWCERLLPASAKTQQLLMLGVK